MFRLLKTDSLDLPELAPYRTMKRPLDHERQGIFVAEGEKVVRRLLESHFSVVSVLLPDKWVHQFEPLLHARSEDIPVYVVQEKGVLEELIGFSMFQGVIAVGRIPASGALEGILAASPKPRLLAAVDALTNAENLGALVRNCVAFGAHGLLVGETSSSPFLRRAVRNSMGTIFQLPVIEIQRQRVRDRGHPASAAVSAIHGDGTSTSNPRMTLATMLQDLRSRGIHCVAAHPHAQGATLSQADFSGDCCIVFGSEGYGLTAPVLGACDQAVAIPMAPSVDSLNVASASAVFLYEVSRQRKKT